jgi:citrate synthase
MFTTTPVPFQTMEQSKITYIDGDRGVLLYRGYPISSWRAAPAYKVCYLLMTRAAHTQKGQGSGRDCHTMCTAAGAPLPGFRATRIRWR